MTEAKYSICVVGGTGAEGSGLALRWAHASHKVTIGSRDESKAKTAASELNAILDHPLMTDPAGNRRKLIIFTEPRDTLDYLATKVRTRLGRQEAVVVIQRHARSP
jgi:predicted dinucleotide-binding enzyme